MINVVVVGGSGYVGAELARILTLHPEVNLQAMTSRANKGRPVAEIYPHLKGLVELEFVDVDPATVAAGADFAFTAVPHATAMAVVPELIENGCRVVDLSADFRIHSRETYEQWYVPHTAPEFLAEAIYGLPELRRSEVVNARLVANPGCYPTSIILGLAPLLAAGVIDPATVIADSKSGTSGAGRGANVGTLFCEVADGFRAYKVGDHRHIPEIEQELSLLAGSEMTINFTPHLLPMSRGILSTVYASLVRDCSVAEISALYEERYGAETFVRMCAGEALPATQYVRGSNFCDIGFRVDQRTGRIIVVSAIDNLVKGAAGQAVQNMNLMAGFAEDTGLKSLPLFP